MAEHDYEVRQGSGNGYLDLMHGDELVSIHHTEVETVIGLLTEAKRVREASWDRPGLPQAGSLFEWSETIIDSVWSTSEPEPQGAYTARLLSLSTDRDRFYSVIDLICPVGQTIWEIAEVERFASIFDATTAFGRDR